MKYTVIWTMHAQTQMADHWVNSVSELRRRITQAVSQIDRELSINPQFVGESRAGADRIMFASPLVAIFEVLPDDRMVRVLTVRLSRR